MQKKKFVKSETANVKKAPFISHFSRLTIPFLFAGVAIMIYIMMKTGVPLKTDTTPKGILDLEFAYNKQLTDKVLTAWSVDGKTEAAIQNTFWDFLFLFFYSLFLYKVCKAIRGEFIAGTWKNKAGNYFANAAIWAGVFDIGENLFMLQTLGGNGNDTVALITSICAGVKWALVALVIIYIIAGLLKRRETEPI